MLDLCLFHSTHVFHDLGSAFIGCSLVIVGRIEAQARMTPMTLSHLRFRLDEPSWRVAKAIAGAGAVFLRCGTIPLV